MGAGAGGSPSSVEPAMPIQHEPSLRGRNAVMIFNAVNREFSDTTHEAYGDGPVATPTLGTYGIVRRPHTRVRWRLGPNRVIKTVTQTTESQSRLCRSQRRGQRAFRSAVVHG